MTSLWYLCIRNFSTIFVTKSIICQENDRLITNVMLWLMQYQPRCKFRIWLRRDFIRANSMTVMYSTKDIKSSSILFMHLHILCMNSYGGIVCPQHVNMQHNYLNVTFLCPNTTWLCWNAQKATTYLKLVGRIRTTDRNSVKVRCKAKRKNWAKTHSLYTGHSENIFISFKIYLWDF